MNKSYYYLISSLPYLGEGAVPLISKAEFVSQVRDSIGEKEAQVFDDFFNHRHVDNSYLSKINGKFEELDKELTVLRARRLGFSIPERLASVTPSERAEAILTETNPLERENMLLSQRMNMLSSISIDNPFSFEGLCSYAVKLDILTRKNSFNKNDGTAELEHLLASFDKKANADSSHIGGGNSAKEVR